MKLDENHGQSSRLQTFPEKHLLIPYMETYHLSYDEGNLLLYAVKEPG